MTITPTEAQQDRRFLAEERLRVQVRRLRQPPTRTTHMDDPACETATTDPAGIDVRPANAYEAVTRQMVESLADDLHEIKSRLNNLLFMIAGAILVDVIGRMIGT